MSTVHSSFDGGMQIEPSDVARWQTIRFDTEQDGYNFYRNYALRVGFEVRVRTRNVSRSIKRVASVRPYVLLVCRQEGFKRNSRKSPKYIDQMGSDIIEPECQAERHCAEGRCGCKASMTLKYSFDELKYSITQWVGEHNGHVLIPQDLRYLLRSNRCVNLEVGLQAELNASVGVNLHTSHQILAASAGGFENLGCSRVDLKNHLRTKRQKDMNPTEGASLQDYFRRFAKDSPGFYYDMQYDSHGLITNIFWADHRMKMDYSLFGDSITFDTTFRTNKAYRPLAIFAGFNHHRQIILFGAALLFDETIPSFEWLFQAFLKCMDNKAPATIFTDQDAAMAAALQSQLPDTFHGLCTWHILQNAKSNVHSSIVGGVTNALRLLMYSVDDETDFDTVWDHCMSDLLLPKSGRNNVLAKSKQWLLRIKQKRQQWSAAWVNKHFTAGMRTTQASESINSTVRGFLKSDHSLLEFFPHFNNLIDYVRQRENVAEFNAKDKLPANTFSMCPIMVSAAAVYTPTVFRSLHYEREQSVAYCVERTHGLTDSGLEKWNVYSFDGDSQKTDQRIVHIGWGDEVVLRCSCSLFKSFGILCRHILKMMDLLGSMGKTQLRTIPPPYIKDRWRSNARATILKQCSGMDSVFPGPEPLSYICRYQRLTATAVRLASTASSDTALYDYVMGQLKGMLDYAINHYRSGHDDGTSQDAGGRIPCDDDNIGSTRFTAGIKARPNPKRGRKRRQRSITEKIGQRYVAAHKRLKLSEVDAENQCNDTTSAAHVSPHSDTNPQSSFTSLLLGFCNASLNI